MSTSAFTMMKRFGFSVEHLSEGPARLDDDGRKNLILPSEDGGPLGECGWLVSGKKDTTCRSPFYGISIE